jgi:hypothetical protein
MVILYRFCGVIDKDNREYNKLTLDRKLSYEMFGMYAEDQDKDKDLEISQSYKK